MEVMTFVKRVTCCEDLALESGNLQQLESAFGRLAYPDMSKMGVI